ncbi:unnamed protein product [Effrenium voratum]|nr:unnamed protein product [Effrenium voratum]
MAKAFAKAFAAEAKLKEVGLAIVADASGKLFKPGKCSLRDLVANQQAIYAVFAGSKGHARLSAFAIKDGLLLFMTTHRLYPPGLRAEAQCVQEWSLRQAYALKKMVGRTRRLLRRSSASKMKALNDLRARLETLHLPFTEKSTKSVDEDGLGSSDTLSELSTLSRTSSGTFSLCNTSIKNEDDRVRRLVEQLQAWEAIKKKNPPNENSPPPLAVQGPTAGTSPNLARAIAFLKGNATCPSTSAKSCTSASSCPPSDAGALNKCASSSVANKEGHGGAGGQLLPSFVLETLKGSFLGKESPPFALSQQYLKNQGGEAAEAENDTSEPGGDEPDESVPLAKRKKQQRVAKKALGAKKPRAKHAAHEYASSRKQFIADLRRGGTSYKEAKSLWDQSATKKHFLQHLSVGELQKRRFVGKGAKTNPWA